MKSFILSMIGALLLTGSMSTAYAWEGFNVTTDTAVEIESGNLVRSGNDIKVYNYETNSYQNTAVENITRLGSTVELEVYDYDSGEYHTLEMDDTVEY